jgi:hypothetical protein
MLLVFVTSELKIIGQPMFRRNISPPSSELNKPSKIPAWKQVASSSTSKMEAIYSSETSVDFQRTTWRYIQEDCTLHNHGCENLKSYIKSCSRQRGHGGRLVGWSIHDRKQKESDVFGEPVTFVREENRSAAWRVYLAAELTRIHYFSWLVSLNLL